MCVNGPKSRRVNICSASKSWMSFDVDFFCFEKMTFLEISDMYFMNFDRNSQYLVICWSNLVNILSKIMNINQI